MLSEFRHFSIMCSMIKNLIFDMGGVLIEWNPSEMLEREHVSEEDRKLIFEKAFNNYKWNLLDAGYYEKEEDFLAEICPTLPEHLQSLITRIVMDFGEEFMRPMPGMEELIKKLSKNGYKIYLLSNAGPGHDKYWSKIPSSRYFDKIMVSALEKMYKPERLIIQHALETFDAKADESVFIDDLAINCAGAFLAGITPINFKSVGSLIEELEKLGVNCN